MTLSPGARALDVSLPTNKTCIHQPPGGGPKQGTDHSMALYGANPQNPGGICSGIDRLAVVNRASGVSAFRALAASLRFSPVDSVQVLSKKHQGWRDSGSKTWPLLDLREENKLVCLSNR